MPWLQLAGLSYEPVVMACHSRASATLDEKSLAIKKRQGPSIQTDEDRAWYFS